MPNLQQNKRTLNAIPKQCIAFYAPLKSPLHPTPSGDRKIAQLISKALVNAGFEVVLASQLRSFDKKGDPHRQQRLIRIAKKEAARILKRWAQHNVKPTAWFSYHLYYKAPDLIGPIICKQLDIPYILAEASWAEKRASGAWSAYHHLVDNALQLASKVICINPIDRIALAHYYRNAQTSPIVSINAFIDNDTLNKAPAQSIMQSRDTVAKLYNLDPKQPWLICIAMMRKGDKHQSFEQLSHVIHKLTQPCQLLIIGDGQMRPQVAAFFNEQNNVKFAGALNNQQITNLLMHFEILVWPAVNEALGMAFLEAQQAGLAIVTANHGGVSSLVSHQHSGFVCTANDTSDMSNQIDTLLNDANLLNDMQVFAKKYVQQNHSLAKTSQQLQQLILDTTNTSTL